MTTAKTPARRTDPVTSRDAAAAVESKLTDRHQKMLQIYALAAHRKNGLTDDEAADIAVTRRLVGRHEQARRLIRTLRELHGRLVPVMDKHDRKRQATRENVSGRRALVWAWDGRPYRG